MRSEEEMFRLILGVAKEDARIKAVYMNGSRANKRVKKDIFQDYDIVYVVEETASFLKDKNWISVFGEPIIIQEPDYLDKIQGREIDFSKGYTYLMQFTDGNRIDLHLETIEEHKESYGTDKLTVPLLDKGIYLKPLPEPSDEDYWVKKPSEGVYYSRCNNFWWVAPYCAKGLWRKEILYANEVMNDYVRKELLTMLSWMVGTQSGFSLSVGKEFKYLKEYVKPEVWSLLLSTYRMGDYESAWKSLVAACELFKEIAPKVGAALGYTYDLEEAERSFAFIRHVRELPEDAKEIYS